MSWFSDNVIDLGGKDKQDKQVPKPAKAPTKPVLTPSVTYKDTSTSNSSPFTEDAPEVSAGDPAAFRQHFEGLLKDNNVPGNDYYEFIAMKNAMTSIPLESQRYETAFLGLSAAGLTKDVIIQTANKYKGLIDKELAEFDAQFNQTFRNDVTVKKQNIADKQKQMTDLSLQISKLNDQIKTLQDESKASEANLTMKRNSFVSAGQEAKSAIDEELAKINQFIQS